MNFFFNKKSNNTQSLNEGNKNSTQESSTQESTNSSPEQIPMKSYNNSKPQQYFNNKKSNQIVKQNIPRNIPEMKDKMSSLTNLDRIQDFSIKKTLNKIAKALNNFNS
jgi:hypothetical protein